MSGSTFHFNHNEKDYKAYFIQNHQMGADGILGFSHWLFEDYETGLQALTETVFPYLLVIQKKL